MERAGQGLDAAGVIRRWAARTRADKSQPEIIKALESVGAKVFVIERPLDLLVYWRGRTFLMEVKEEEGQLTDAQIKFIRDWPGEIHVVRGVRDALGCIRVSVL